MIPVPEVLARASRSDWISSITNCQRISKKLLEAASFSFTLLHFVSAC